MNSLPITTPEESNPSTKCKERERDKLLGEKKIHLDSKRNTVPKKNVRHLGFCLAHPAQRGDYD